MTDDLATRISALSDDDAVAALALALDEYEPTMDRLEELEEVEKVVPQALAQVDFIDPAEFATTAAAGATISAGELARETLRFLAEDGNDQELVARALNVPRSGAQRDLITLVVGGLVVAALTRTGVRLDRDKAGRWSFHFEVRPMKDSSTVGLIKRLLEYCLGKQ